MPILSLTDIESRLRETKPKPLAGLWAQADRVRHDSVGDAVHLRGLIELSNHCDRDCHYCGLRRGRRSLARYRMSAEEVLACAVKAVEFRFGTVVLQAGEDPGLDPTWVADLVRKIKNETGLAVTLSLGEQSEAVFRAWKQAGADRYLLRIETTNAQLLRHIHPGEPHGTRVQNLERLADLGYEVGSGIMVGIPGQTYAMLAKDIAWFRKMDLDMIGIGPYLPHPDTPLAGISEASDQVPRDEVTVEKTLALTRLVCPDANLPATTALATLNRAKGRENALCRGANVVMPNLTPVRYRRMYEIYPHKACIDETDEACYQCLTRRIITLGRTIGIGPGSRQDIRAARQKQNQYFK
jgi:biotin synthase